MSNLHVTVDGITVGKTGDLKLGKVTVTPDLFSLLQPTKVIKSIEIDSLELTQNVIEKIRYGPRRMPPSRRNSRRKSGSRASVSITHWSNSARGAWARSMRG